MGYDSTLKNPGAALICDYEEIRADKFGRCLIGYLYKAGF